MEIILQNDNKMKISIKRTNDEYSFLGTNSNGDSIRMDNIRMPQPQGVSPMEAVLMAIGGCSGIDILNILQKQKQEVKGFYCNIEAQRKEVDGAKPFSEISIHFYLTGNIDAKKAQRAAELSFEKYCSVSKSLHPDIQITYEVIINPETSA